MSISGVGNANSYIYENVNKTNNRNNGTDRFDRFGVTTASNSRGVSEQSSRFSAYDAYQSATTNVWFRSEIGEFYIQNLERRNANFSYQAKGGLQKVDNERYLIDVMDTIEGCWYIYDKERDERMIFNPMNTSIQTDENTGKDYIVSCDPWGGLMNVMEADHALVESIKAFLQTDNVTKLNLNEKYTIEVHAATGIEYLKVKGREGYGTWFLTSAQEMLDKLQNLANLYKEKYPNIVTEDGIAMGEVEGSVVRTANGILEICCNGMIYRDNTDPSKSWGVMWSINDTDVYLKIKQAMTEGIIAGSDVEDYEIWKAFFEEQEIEFEKALSDEELAAIANPSFARVISYEEIMKDWEEQVKANLKKYGMTTAEAMLAADPQASQRMWRIGNSSKLYTFNEFIKYIEEERKKLMENSMEDREMSINGVSTNYYSTAYTSTSTAKSTETNSFADTIAEKAATASVRDYDEEAFESVGSNAPQSVKDAWMEAAKETGANGLGLTSNGQYHTEMLTQQIIAWYNGGKEGRAYDVLGSSVESAIQAAQQALYNFDHPLEPNRVMSIEERQYHMKERQFYVLFLEKLEKLQQL